MSQDKDLKEIIMDLAKQRGRDKTFCPSEAARALEPEGWRRLMEDVRNAALDLRKEGKIQIEQNGEKITGEQFSGPIRLRFSERECR